MIMNIDTDLLRKYAYDLSGMTADDNTFVNWLGITTDSRLFNNHNEIRGRLMGDLPIGGLGDGVYGSPFEYLSLLSAIDASASRDIFTAIELGAGWGPWISTVGAVCLRLGFKKICLVGVEADPVRYDMMLSHLERNNIINTCDVRTMRGAAWETDTTLYWPKIDWRDHGASASSSIDKLEHRGGNSSFIEIPGFSLNTICDGLHNIDYIHMDMQGAELNVIKSSIELINERVRRMFIGTHARSIEAELLELLRKNRWDVPHERNCPIRWDLRKPTVDSMVFGDGEIIAVNTRQPSDS